MIKHRAVCALALLACSPAAASDFDIRVMGGAVVPSGVGASGAPAVAATWHPLPWAAVEASVATGRHDAGIVGGVRSVLPALTVQWRPGEWHGLRPYVGVGIGGALLWQSDDAAGPIVRVPAGYDRRTRRVVTAPTPAIQSVSYRNAVGPVVQAGVDYVIDDRWSVGVDVKYMRLRTDVKVGTPLGPVRESVRLDPVVVGVVVTYRW